MRSLEDPFLGSGPHQQRMLTKRPRVTKDRFSANNFALLEEEQDEFLRKRQRF